MITLLLAAFTFLFVSWSDAVGRIARVFGDDPTKTGGLADEASVLLLLVLLCLLAIAYFFLGPRLRARADRSYSADDVAEALRKQANDQLKTLTIVGYSLSFAEPIRLLLEQSERRNLKVFIAVPEDAFITSYCKEDTEIDHRVRHLDKRAQEWKRLESAKRVATVKIFRHQAPPHLFAIMFDKRVIFYGRYPFEHKDGMHVLHQNAPRDRRLLRVDDKTPPILFDTISQQIECQTTSGA